MCISQWLNLQNLFIRLTEALLQLALSLPQDCELGHEHAPFANKGPPLAFWNPLPIMTLRKVEPRSLPTCFPNPPTHWAERLEAVGLLVRKTNPGKVVVLQSFGVGFPFSN